MIPGAASLLKHAAIGRSFSALILFSPGGVLRRKDFLGVVHYVLFRIQTGDRIRTIAPVVSGRVREDEGEL